MDHKLLRYITPWLLTLLLAACSDDLLPEPGTGEFEEGELSEISIALNVGSLKVDGGDTRSENPNASDIPSTEQEKRVDNLWVFQYDSAGNMLIRPRYYTVDNQAELQDFKVWLKEGVRSTICVVANTGEPRWTEFVNTNFTTLEQLKAQTIPEPDPQMKNLSLPMWGCKEVETVSLDDIIQIDAERMYARLDVVLDNMPETLELNSIEIKNISWNCQVSTRYKNDSEAAQYPADRNIWISRSWVAKDLPRNAEGNYDYVSIYVPENIQGVIESLSNETTAQQKNDSAPRLATNVNFHVTYTEPETGAESSYTYTVHPGGNYYNNYNIRRNCIYRVHVDVQHDDNARHTPSSNCMVTAPGKTISFEPYYRTEIGGGYNIQTYLDTLVQEKTIDYVKIRWQSTDRIDPDDSADHTVIGDNSAGNLVWYNKANKKIYVKTRRAGNALIAAYNSDGQIIWSWHIWSIKDLEPQNPGNAQIYTTYNWDSDGMHANRSRVPGYAVMKCNLGALTDDPTEDSNNWFQTWGLYYQWGRKDPFPQARTETADYGPTSWNENNLNTKDGRAPCRTHDYDTNYVTALYDNENHRISGITSGERTAEGEMFYTYSVWKSGTPSQTALVYAINNPTVFMAGDDQPGHYSIYDPVQGEDFNTESGDWLPTEEMDNKLWGGLDGETEHYDIPGSNYNTIYRNYGTEKSIFDPCPKGWRVPPDDLWVSFTKSGTNPKPLGTGFIMADDVNFDASRNVPLWHNHQGPGMWMYIQEWKSGPTLFFPIQGVRRPRGHISRVLMCGSYLSAGVGKPIQQEAGKPYWTGGNWLNCLHIHYPQTTQWNGLYFMIFESANAIFRSKSTGGNIRCVRDTY